jgi:hypothetical protein
MDPSHSAVAHGPGSLAQPRPKSAARSRCRVVGTAWYSSDESGAGGQGTVRHLTPVELLQARNKPKVRVAMLQWALLPADHAPHAWHLDLSQRSVRGIRSLPPTFRSGGPGGRLTLLGQIFRCSLLAQAPLTSQSWGFGRPYAKLGALGE